MSCWKEGATLLLVLLVLLDLQLVAGWSSHHRSLRRQTRGHHERRAHQNITLAVILPQSNTGYPWAWPRIGPALERAVKTINADPILLPDHHLTYAFKNSEDKNGICSESIAPLMAVDLKLAYDPWAFIGPGCSYTSSPVGLFTTHWDIPMVTAGAPAVAFYGGVYPSITNTGPTHKKLGKFALRICEHFGWREHVMLIFSDNKVDDRPCYFAVEGLYTELTSINISLVDRVFEENKVPINYSHILSNLQNDGRVMFVCCSPDVFRKLMVQFRRADLPHEQYVFFYIDVFGDSLNSRHRQPWVRGDEDDAIAKEAFQSVKILTYREPQNPEYREFVSNLKTDARTMFNYTIEDTLMNIIAGGFYDGLMLYTHALNESMSAAGSRPPGKVVTKRMWNRTFHVPPLKNGQPVLLSCRSAEARTAKQAAKDHVRKRWLRKRIGTWTGPETAVAHLAACFTSLRNQLGRFFVCAAGKADVSPLLVARILERKRRGKEHGSARREHRLGQRSASGFPGSTFPFSAGGDVTGTASTSP